MLLIINYLIYNLYWVYLINNWLYIGYIKNKYKKYSTFFYIFESIAKDL